MSDRLSKEEVLRKSGINARLLRFWVREYRLERFVTSRKTGNLYEPDIVTVLRLIDHLKKRDIFTTRSIKKMIRDFISHRRPIHEMDFFCKEEELFSEFLKEKTVRKDVRSESAAKVKRAGEKKSDDEEYYFDRLQTAQQMAEEGRTFDAVNLLTLIVNNSRLYNAVAKEMLQLIEKR
ncbi:MAG: MerR family transcriptional regulator [Candidatus Muiribacteriaceae bacterium]